MVATKKKATVLCVDQVESFSELFYQRSNFDAGLSQWNTTIATNVRQSFYFATSFKKGVDLAWDVKIVWHMKSMFGQQPISQERVWRTGTYPMWSLQMVCL